MTIRACLIDVDGTAVLSEHRNRAAIEEVARDAGFNITIDHWRDGYAGAGDEIIWKKICGERPEFREVYSTAEAFEQACIEGYRKRLSEVEVNQPVLDLVHYFNQNSIYTGIVSNSLGCVVRDNLEQTHYPVNEFQVMVCKDDVRDRGLKTKPSPGPYQLALQLLNERLPDGAKPIQPSECLILEDSKTGSRAGMHFGGVTVQILDDDTPLPKAERKKLTREFNGTYHACMLDTLHHVVWSVLQGESDAIKLASSRNPQLSMV